MADFQAKPLGILDRLYNFVGGLKGTSRIQLETPIQLVHDVSREAEKGNRIGIDGFVTVGYPATHIGAGSINGVESIDARVSVLTGIPRVNLDVWLLDAYAYSNNASWSFISVAAALPTGFSSGGGLTGIRYVPVFYSAGVLTVSDSTAAGTITVAIPNSGLLLPSTRFPLHCPEGTIITTRSTATGASVITMACLLWVGPRGGTPPGLA